MTESIMEYMTLAGNKEKALNAVQQALSLRVKNLHDFKLGGEISAGLKKLEWEISSYWKESVDAAKNSYDTQRNLRDADLKPVQEARKQIDQLCGEWKTEQDRKARLEQARLEQAERRKPTSKGRNYWRKQKWNRMKEKGKTT